MYILKLTHCPGGSFWAARADSAASASLWPTASEPRPAGARPPPSPPPPPRRCRFLGAALRSRRSRSPKPKTPGPSPLTARAEAGLRSCPAAAEVTPKPRPDSGSYPARTRPTSGWRLSRVPGCPSAHGTGKSFGRSAPGAQPTAARWALREGRPRPQAGGCTDSSPRGAGGSVPPSRARIAPPAGHRPAPLRPLQSRSSWTSRVSGPRPPPRPRRFELSGLSRTLPAPVAAGSPSANSGFLPGKPLSHEEPVGRKSGK